MRKTILLLAMVASTLFTQSQPTITPPDLLAQLDGKTKFTEIWTIVTNYITTKRNQAQSADSQSFLNKLYKQWYRWYLFNAARLDAKGNIINVTAANQQALKAMQGDPALMALNGNAQWTLVGPTDRLRIGSGHNSGLGRVNCIAFHPSDANQLFIGTPAGGMWKSSNGGTTWLPLTDMLPTLGVNGIVVDWSNSNRIYILTGDGDGGNMGSIGVLVSTDGGGTWAQTGNFPGVTDKSYHGCKLIQHPTAAGTLLAATTAGIFRTTDFGANWVLEQAGDFTDIEMKPGDPTIMYAARRNSATPFYRSTNTGDTWSTAGITGVPTNATRIAIGVSPNSSGYVYLLAGPATSTNNFVGIYRSLNSGLAFETKATTPNILGYANDGNDASHQTNYDLCMEVSRTDVGIITTGGINLWYSASFGNAGTMVRRTQWYDDSPGEYVHADIHNLAINPLNNRLYVCSDGGVSYSDNNGVNWTRLWASLSTMQFYHMTGNADANLLVGGTQDNGTNYRKSNTSVFHHIEGADGYSAIIDWASTNRVFMSENGGLNRTDDGGTTAYGIKAPGADDCWPMLAQHPADDDTIFAGHCNGVFKSNNKGGAGSWSNMGFYAPTELAIAPTNGRRLAGAWDWDIRKTDNGGTTWTALNTKPNFPNGSNVTDIAFDPTTSNGLIVTVGGTTAGRKIFYSGNFGDNWTNISYNLPNAPATACAMDVPGNIYIGTDVGVFVLKWGTTQWTPFYNFLPKTIVNDFIINEAAGLIRAATYGRGVWQTELFGACPVDLTLINNQVYNQRYWQASNSISSQQIIMNTEGNQTFYSAGNYVELKPGFFAMEGSDFKAYNSPCDNGIPIRSALNRDYAVAGKSELLKANFKQTDSLAAGNTSLIVTKNTGGSHAVTLALAQPEFVTLYAERESDGEIISMIMQAPVKAGTYTLDLNLAKLEKKGIRLRWKAGAGNRGLLNL